MVSDLFFMIIFCKCIRLLTSMHEFYVMYYKPNTNKEKNIYFCVSVLCGILIGRILCYQDEKGFIRSNRQSNFSK